MWYNGQIVTISEITSMTDIQFAPTNGNGVIYVRSASDIPSKPDPSVVYMIWDGVDYRNAVRYEASGGNTGRSGPVVEYTTANLPDPSTLAVGTSIVLSGNFAADVTSVLLTVDYVKGVKSWTGSVVSANDPVDGDGLPDGVTWVKV